MADEELKLDEPSERERGPFQARKEDYEATRRRKALCLKNFMKIVERFAQNPVTAEMLAIALPWLEREQFDDIPVERFAYKNCGYVLCRNTLTENHLNQKYRISVARRRVYEVGDRKYFCSDWCYRASCYLRHQIPSDPAWCRALPTGPMLSLKFLPAHAPGRPGKTILDALANLRLNADIENTGMNIKGEYSSSEDEDEYYDLKKKISDTEDKSSGSSDGDASSSTSGDKSVPWNEVIPQPRKAKIIERKSKAPKQSSLKSEKEKSEREQKNMEVVVNVKNKTPSKQDLKSAQRVELDPKEVVLNRIQEWVTKEAVEVLYSEDPTTSEVQAKPSGYGAKVSAFFSEDAEMEKGQDIVLPLVNSVSQGSYRLQMLMESLLPNLKNILFRMKVPLNPVYDKLRDFVAHFYLTNKNVHVWPKELNIMCYSLLHLLTAKDEKLIPHKKLVEMLSASFDGDEAKTEAHLTSVMEIADKLHEESLDMPS
ncbi:unnamed protein product [Hymenolepis diminuta]|nr:unnamed protein product [Hymenolepis diminuta]